MDDQRRERHFFSCTRRHWTQPSDQPKRLSKRVDMVKREIMNSAKILISHTHKFVFVKTTKTAGSSLEALLTDYLKEGDRITTRLELKQDKEEKKRLKARGMKFIRKTAFDSVALTPHSPLWARTCCLSRNKKLLFFWPLTQPIQSHNVIFSTNKLNTTWKNS